MSYYCRTCQSLSRLFRCCHFRILTISYVSDLTLIVWFKNLHIVNNNHVALAIMQCILYSNYVYHFMIFIFNFRTILYVISRTWFLISQFPNSLFYTIELVTCIKKKQRYKVAPNKILLRKITVFIDPSLSSFQIYRGSSLPIPSPILIGFHQRSRKRLPFSFICGNRVTSHGARSYEGVERHLCFSVKSCFVSRELWDWRLPIEVGQGLLQLQAWVSANGVLKDCLIKVYLWDRILMKY